MPASSKVISTGRAPEGWAAKAIFAETRCAAEAIHGNKSQGVALSLCDASEYALLRDIEALIRMPITVDGGERPSGVVRAGRRGARPEPCGERTRRDDFHRRISLEGTMARKPNYNFEKRQREIQKKEKKAAKAEAKRLQAEARKEGEGQKSETPSAGGSA